VDPASPSLVETGPHIGFDASRPAQSLRLPPRRPAVGSLGHTNAAFTVQTYMHVVPEMDAAAANQVGGRSRDRTCDRWFVRPVLYR
jgi:hypothetical protein